jgi:hypothetical protein
MGSMNQSSSYIRLRVLVAIIAFVVMTVGLVLSASSAKGIITGKVNFKGEPLPSGLVVFVDRDDNCYPARIQRDGSYTTAVDVPCGPMKVTVATVRLGKWVHPGSGNFPPSYVRIPRHYAYPDKSGLAVNVRRGPQVFMIDLDDDFDAEE